MNKIILISLEVIFLLSLLFLKEIGLDISQLPFENQILSAGYYLLVYIVILDVCFRIFRFVYIKRLKLKSSDNFLNGIGNIYRLLLILGILLSFPGFFGLELQSVFTSLSIVAAAIAIISKEYINDIIVGLYYSFSKNLEIYDYVKIGEQKGKIIEIGLVKIKLLNDDDDIVIIPNSKVYSNEILNYTKLDSPQMSVDFQVDLKLVGSIEQLENEIITTLSPFSEYIEKESYNLKIVEMKKDYVDLKFQYSLRRIDRDLQRKIRRKTVREVLNLVTKKTELTRQQQP